MPVYEALSYTWGSADGPIDLFVDVSRRSDQSLPLTWNLECALQHLRYTDKPRILWIDAICVNQQGLSERSKQVARMAGIYSLAKEVLVWLGPEADNSTSALETLRKMGNLVEVNFSANTLSPSSNAKYSDELALANPMQKLLCTAERVMPIHLLFGRPWFERLWIQQEIRLATSATIICGFQTLPCLVVFSAVGVPAAGVSYICQQVAMILRSGDSLLDLLGDISVSSYCILMDLK